MRGLVVVADHEAVHVADDLAVGGDDVAGAADLRLALRDAVVGHAEVLVVGRHVAADVGVAQVRRGEHLLDADVPVRVLDRDVAEPKVLELLHRLEAACLVDSAGQANLLVTGRSREADGHEPRGARRLPRPDHQVRDALGGGVDDQIRELAEAAVRAADRRAELETHPLAHAAVSGSGAGDSAGGLGRNGTSSSWGLPTMPQVASGTSFQTPGTLP